MISFIGTWHWSGPSAKSCNNHARTARHVRTQLDTSVTCSNPGACIHTPCNAFHRKRSMRVKSPCVRKGQGPFLCMWQLLVCSLKSVHTSACWLEACAVVDKAQQNICICFPAQCAHLHGNSLIQNLQSSTWTRTWCSEGR